LHKLKNKLGQTGPKYLTKNFIFNLSIDNFNKSCQKI
jgi:hypothetical protein